MSRYAKTQTTVYKCDACLTKLEVEGEDPDHDWENGWIELDRLSHLDIDHKGQVFVPERLSKQLLCPECALFLAKAWIACLPDEERSTLGEQNADRRLDKVRR